MSDKKINWFKVAESVTAIDFHQNNMCITEAGGKTITLALYNNKVFAFAHKCPHAGGIMADGFIDAVGNAVCPLHRYKFNMQNGRNISGEGYYLKTYRAEERPEGVFVGIEEKTIFGWL